jgi:hypothetical protein
MLSRNHSAVQTAIRLLRCSGHLIDMMLNRFDQFSGTERFENNVNNPEIFILRFWNPVLGLSPTA